MVDGMSDMGTTELGAASTPEQARAAFRDGLVRPTCGIAQGYAQANLMILPKEQAFDFLLFAQRNPKPCPLLEVMEPGVTALVTAPGADIRTDVPLYRVWKRGELVAEVPDIREYWRSDLVTFVIGCSFTFEFPLMEAGVPVRHITAGRNVPMYDTSIECRSAGAFHSTMVVSMRGIPSTQVADACRISGYYPSVHGAPVCVGDPSAIGIDDIMHPDYGDAPRVGAGRCAGVLGVRRDPAGRGDGVQTGIRDHARAGAHVHHQQTRFGIHGVRGSAMSAVVAGSVTGIDMNSDMGESFGRWTLGDDEALLDVVSSANVACGFHAGDPSVMLRTLSYAASRGVMVGAHVAYRDLAGFGRRYVDESPDELKADVMYQIAALEGMARSVGAQVRYVKPHGALYNRIVRDESQAAAVVDAIRAVDASLAILTQPGAVVGRLAAQAGLRVFHEAFADRAYNADGTLVSRRLPDAVIADPAEVAARVLRMVREHEVVAIDGTVVPLNADSVCVHGDSPSAVAMARAVRARLESEGVAIRAFAGDAAASAARD